MKTKHLVKFLNNSSHLDTDLEFIEIINLVNNDGRFKQDGTNLIFDFVDPQIHKKLSTRANSEQARKLAMNHLRNTVRTAFIKRLYETTTIYFRDILKSATDKGMDSDKLIGEHSISLTSRELLQIGNYEKIVEKISSSIFRQLENEKNTKKLIDKLDRKLGLGVGNEIISNALPYLEIRHLLVHNAGKADQDFCDTFPFIEAEEGKLIKLSTDLINNARNALITLIKEFDKKIVEKELINQSELQP
ncbi:MAG: hypothetical protein ACFHU9_01570 [Fluviicola sp.]